MISNFKNRKNQERARFPRFVRAIRRASLKLDKRPDKIKMLAAKIKVKRNLRIFIRNKYQNKISFQNTMNRLISRH